MSMKIMNNVKNSSIFDNSTENRCFCCPRKSKIMRNVNDKHKQIFSKLLKIEEEILNTYCKFVCKSCNLQLQASYRFLNKVEQMVDCFKTEMSDFSHLKNRPLINKEAKTKINQQFTSCILCNILNATEKSLPVQNFCEEHCSVLGSLFNGYLENCKSEETEKWNLENNLIENTLSQALKYEDLELKNNEDFNSKFDTSIDNLEENIEFEETGSKDTCENDKKVEYLICRICQKSYKTSYKLKKHMKTHTGDLPFKCQYCEKKFVSKADTENHERRHTKEKPFICNVCGKALSAASALRTHMKQHTGRPEKCKICNKTFCRKSELTLHIKKHEGNRPFLCTQCGSSFAQRSHLTEHLTIHTNVRPFKCDQCEKSFKKRTLLKQHQQLHRGLKNFKCSKCPYACYKKYRLKQHTKIHYLETDKEHKNHICPVCSKEYTTVSGLNTHVSAMHNVIV